MKRIRKVDSDPNPLFMQWLLEFRKEAIKKQKSTLVKVYNMCIENLKRFPLTIQTGSQCKILRGFSTNICSRLDKKLAQHQAWQSAIQPGSSADHCTAELQLTCVTSVTDVNTKPSTTVVENAGSQAQLCEENERDRKRLVYYDLETTGLGFHNKHKDIEIVEIGAVDGETKETFRQFILPPSNRIPKDASNVHGFFLKGGCLYRNYKKLDAVDLKTGLENFLFWLKRSGEPITLAGYNSHNYDDWVICHNFLRKGFSATDGGIVKFLDVSKIVRPYLKTNFGQKKWNLTFAVKTCLGREQSDAHTAVSDAMDTLDLMVKLGGEEIPEKAMKDACLVESMCVRLAQGFSIKDPKMKYSKKATVVKKKVLHKKEPLVETSVKLELKEDKAETIIEAVKDINIEDMIENKEPNVWFIQTEKKKYFLEDADNAHCNLTTVSKKRKCINSVVDRSSKKQRLPVALNNDKTRSLSLR